MKTGVLVVLALNLLGAAQAGDAAKDLKLMEGTWSGTFLETGGKPFPDQEKAVKLKLVIKGDKYTVFLEDKKFVEGTLKLDPAKKPKAIAAIAADGAFKGMVQPGIYQIDANAMRVVFSKPGAERPTEFKTKEGTDEVLISYQRIKDGK